MLGESGLVYWVMLSRICQGLTFSIETVLLSIKEAEWSMFQIWESASPSRGVLSCPGFSSLL